jgi:hypothetical protein
MSKPLKILSNWRAILDYLIGEQTLENDIQLVSKPN